MRSFFFPCLILMGIALFFAFIGVSSFEKVSRVQRDVASMEQSVDTAKMEKDTIQSALSRLSADSRPAGDFIKEWQRTFMTSDEAKRIILPHMDSLAVDNIVSSSQKQTHTEAGYNFRNKVIPVEDVQITVSGEYYRLLNWLGAVEQEFPLARVESVNITNLEGLKMSSTFSFPTNFQISATAASPTPAPSP